ncbi:hypothetical protein GGI07_005940, partial [Coemansia sp. Benny D115]
MPFKEHSLDNEVDRIVQKVTTCLVQARKAGVLHRDISTSNIVVTESSVSVIDWGYSRTDDSVLPCIKEKVNTAWDIDIDEITTIEEENDGNIGTPSYMGVRILMGGMDRSLLDDIESLFYVVMALYTATGTGKVNESAPGFLVSQPYLAAAAKVGFLSDDKNFPIYFGIRDYQDQIGYLDKFRQLLFFANGRFIGGNLLTSAESIRTSSCDDVVHTLLDAEHSRMWSLFSSTYQSRLPSVAAANDAILEVSTSPAVAAVVEAAASTTRNIAPAHAVQQPRDIAAAPVMTDEGTPQMQASAARSAITTWVPADSHMEPVPQAPHSLQGASKPLTEEMKKSIETLAWAHSKSITNAQIGVGFIRAALKMTEFTLPYRFTDDYLKLIEEYSAKFPSCSERVLFILAALHLYNSTILPSTKPRFNNSGTRNAPHDSRAQANQSSASKM